MAKWNVFGISSVVLTFEAKKLTYEAEGRIITLWDEPGDRLASITVAPGVAVWRADIEAN